MTLEELFTDWRRLLATVPTVDAKAAMFSSLAQNAAGYVARGLDRAKTVDELYDIAVSNGIVEARGIDTVQVVISDAFVQAQYEGDNILRMPKARGGNGVADDSIAAINPFPIDGASLPRRPWMLPGLLLRGQVTLMVAPPGSGKSLLTLQLAMVCAAGLPEWAGWRPRGAFRSLVINVEEDETEMRRRLLGAQMKMGIEQSRLSGIYIAQASSIVVATADSRTKTVTATPMLEKIAQTIIRLKIDIVIVDPFAETFAGDENSNSELKWAAVLWREVSRRTNCAVLLVHHAKKYSAQMAGDMDAARGGGALSGVARVVCTLFGMTSDEAKGFGVADEERVRYLRFDDAKANLSLMSGSARWFEKHSVSLGNAGDGLPADEVGVLMPWAPPSIWDDMPEDKSNLILEEIGIGVRNDDGCPSGDPYSPTKKGGSKRWVGLLIQRVLECSEASAREVVDTWTANGLLVTYLAPTSSSKGNNRECLRVDLTKRPGTVVEEAFL
jgi:KaiC/GvpD/RAD55 family RecA-like ATPase